MSGTATIKAVTDGTTTDTTSQTDLEPPRSRGLTRASGGPRTWIRRWRA
jgi:hypothetical protein